MDTYDDLISEYLKVLHSVVARCELKGQETDA
ncbi:hypothetical protein KGEDBEEJ_02090 [Aeromonas hydrophila]